MNSAHDLKAPFQQGGVLLWPNEHAVAEFLRLNRLSFEECKTEILGSPLSEWRMLAIREVTQLARSFMRLETDAGSLPTGNGLIVGGHQPELFHPGVWIKNFVMNYLGRKHDLLPLNLVVDNDVPKSATLGIPKPAQYDALHSLVKLPFDHHSSEAPYEDWVLHDRELFHNLPHQAKKLVGDWKEHPLLFEFWNEAQKQLEEDARPGVAFAKSRRIFERKWGVTNLELPISILCESEAFQVFVLHMLQNAESFLKKHNEAVLGYRQRHGLRSKNHPFAELANGKGWMETPFWLMVPESPRRQRLGVKVETDGEIRLGTPGPNGIRVPLGKTDLLDALRSISEKGFRIRPRAIATTLFARLFLADLFLHGIGGGKYDEVTDQLCQSFFGLTAPKYLVASATFRLNLLQNQTSIAEVRQAHHLWRDSLWNPQRHFPAPTNDSWNQLLHQKSEFLALPQNTRLERKIRYQKLRLNLEAMQKLVESKTLQLQQEAGKIQLRFEAEQLIQGREFAFVLFSETRLKQLFTPYLPG